MFIESKYTVIYFSIIEKAKFRKLEGYSELHHIIPKSLGGNDNEENFVRLTFKEHYICHRLLCKMVSNKSGKNKMQYSLFCMLRSNALQDRNLNFFQKFKCLEANREASKNRNHKPHLGKKHSEESKRKIGIKSKGRLHTEETKKKISDSNVRTNQSRGMKVKAKLLGSTKSPEHRQKISAALRLRHKKILVVV